MTGDVLDFLINNGASATSGTAVTLTNIVCGAGVDIAFGNSADPTNWVSCSASKAHTLTV